MRLGTPAIVSRRSALSVNRGRVLAALSTGQDWESVGRELGISPGLAYMIASGIPADGSDALDRDGRLGAGPSPSSPQALVNPRSHNPVRNERVEVWVAERAARELRP